MDIFRFLTFRYSPRRSWKALVVLPCLGLLLALAGPFGSYTSMGFWDRCAHFALCFMIIGWMIMEGAYRLARRFFAGHWPLWASLLFDVSLAVPSAAIVWASLHVFGPRALPHVGFIDLIWQNLFLTLAVQAAIVVAALMRDSQLLQADPQPATGKVYPLAHRLPFALRRSAVLALSSEDHYLRVYTARGEALIHMTLTEAVELLKDGFQIHRSHWVHDGAVQDYKDNQVELTTGLRLPLSRHRKKAFEMWLAKVA
ncbi:LytTR family DNA-binding domain-containing protein [Asticcacaulis sp. 201]|uniref:LytTR family DNA-binding domain-containing protein n=1 Tax=Asticcacaulis sp. 201 TaxID=3028787 RepID=UPI002916EA83|nr:LytTR family DNA-binding domain-containing protein [Asticcacaulis sp. 201]MDV6331645.1 LytTR family DNA-binding domain-containing protein [Asticcacaulis sp. 201]